MKTCRIEARWKRRCWVQRVLFNEGNSLCKFKEGMPRRGKGHPSIHETVKPEKRSWIHTHLEKCFRERLNEFKAIFFFLGLNWSEDQCLSTSPLPMSLLCLMHTFDFSRNELLLWFPVSQAGASEMWVSGGTWCLRNYSLFSGWRSWTWRGGGGQVSGESELTSLRAGRNEHSAVPHGVAGQHCHVILGELPVVAICSEVPAAYPEVTGDSVQGGLVHPRLSLTEYPKKVIVCICPRKPGELELRTASIGFCWVFAHFCDLSHSWDEDNI